MRHSEILGPTRMARRERASDRTRIRGRLRGCQPSETHWPSLTIIRTGVAVIHKAARNRDCASGRNEADTTAITVDAVTVPRRSPGLLDTTRLTKSACPQCITLRAARGASGGRVSGLRDEARCGRQRQQLPRQRSSMIGVTATQGCAGLDNHPPRHREHVLSITVLDPRPRPHRRESCG